ncbi:MAG TPA: GNAT family N-acetyltransferase [Thermoanaerobaculia bacterium]|nr:GNAT family N-acetyltransferase [Thermoanaerobaculia bacterium]
MDIRPLAIDDEARRCAGMMCSTDPWVTLGRSFDECLAAVRDPTQEIYLATDDGRILGFIILTMKGAFTGYIRTVCVDAEERGHGIGSRLVEFAENRIFRDTPNVFLCVSSFNPRARALYERLGYEPIGELKNYIVDGASELLMRKTIGPLRARAPRRT